MKTKKSPKLVTNKKKAETLQSLSVNVSNGLIRNDTLEGREHIVAPMVMIVEGVLNGSQGPLFYPAEELKKFVGAWNHKPVVVYHPEVNGQGVSACDPKVIDEYKIGVILNTKFEDGKLKAEAWLEADRIQKVDNRIAEAIENNQMMELSTGVFIEMDETPGDFNGTPYDAIARNYRPDHLAILPDKIGACSIEMGAGFIRNKLKIDIDDFVLNAAERRIQNSLAPYFKVNELSQGNIRQMLSQALNDKYNPDPWDEKDVYLWIEDVFETYVIYEIKGKLYKISYAKSDSSVTLEGEPEEVYRETQYKTVEGALLGNEINSTHHNTNMKKKLIDALIKNHGWDESERETLNAMSEDRLKSLMPDDKAEEGAADEQANNDSGKEKKDTRKPAPAANADADLTPEEFIAKAPAGMQDMLRSGLAAHNDKKASLVATITANEKNKFSEKQLNSFDMGTLENLAELAKVQASPEINDATRRGFYHGQAPAANQNGEKPEALVAPSMDFNSES